METSHLLVTGAVLTGLLIWHKTFYKNEKPQELSLPGNAKKALNRNAWNLIGGKWMWVNEKGNIVAA